MNPILIQIGPVQVHWYGVLIVFGALLAAWLATKEAERRGEDPEHVWNILTWALILGIIGARLYHVFSTPNGSFANWAYYRQHPVEIVAFWNGGFRGLGIFGAVIGGVIAVALYTWRHHLSLLRWLGFLAPGLLLAQGIGRLGNRVNQELYGPLTNLPWAFHINPTYPCQEPLGSPMACGVPERLTAAARDWYATHGFQPDFYYEGAWNLVGFALLWGISRRLSHWLRDGDIFFMYLIWYPVGRFWVEALRPDAWRIGILATAQWFSLAGILIGVVGLIVNHHRSGRSTSAVPSTPEEPVASDEVKAQVRAD
jgi:phosphatidylglycerol:prolipoprotein diacylglycerol transferase